PSNQDLLPFPTRRSSDLRGIKRARFAVLRLTRVPAVLVEGGFLTEQGESQLIAKKDWRVKLAQAIGAGVQNYVALGVKKQPPMLDRKSTRLNSSHEWISY